ncbi:MAG TPA: PSD1 and planctomycete cytochrome C domain-containing protein [Pirellulaceae bacterium]|nr:PSD1 and planctomycete cytochrome C domain-containing protein [Pirellulaceae bacterium]
MRAAIAYSCLILAALLFGAASARGDEKSAERPFAPADLEFFEAKIRPILATRCHECHGPRKQESNLRLDSRQSLLAGGDNGPAARPGDPQHSLLVKAVHYDGDLQMPPKGKLDDAAIAALTSWVERGLPWPQEVAAARTTGRDVARFTIRTEDRQFWSLRPVAMPPLPAVQDASWPQTAIDRFILARLETEGLSHSPPADNRTLLRRISFDLTGLPPTPEEVESFVADESPDAYERVVDRLLASPRYGERWARHWLDVARYGEDQAHTFQSRKYPEGYRYRDWLIGAFNRDMPYDEFVRQQIAADLIDGDDKLARLPALGFFACGPVYYGDKSGMDQISDRIDTLSRGFLGLTVACARCHDHKYDPISTVDYYALAGVFASTEYVETPLVSAEEVATAEKALTEKEKKDKVRPKYPFVHALKEGEPKALRVHIRGSADNLGDEAPRRFMEVLCTSEPAPFQQGSGRLELAAAIVSADNPLTGRVIVNRLWQQHFGKGLVRTPSNFGVLGERPTHPELLDWLAAELVSGNWELKRMQRRIVASATYRQASQFQVQGSRFKVESNESSATNFELGTLNIEPQSIDPENKWLWRFPRRRLEVEAWRDAMLEVTQRLDGAIGGPPSDLANADNRRRTLYGAISRHELNDLLRLFDFPDPNVTAEQRPTTTVPLQQLFVLNSEFMAASAKALAARLAALEGPDDTARVRQAFEIVFTRPASEQEVALAMKFVSGENAEEGLSRWERFCQALLASNEFLYVD